MSYTDMAKTAPPVAVAGLEVFGVTLSDLTYICTIGYTLVMLYFLLRDKWWRQRGKH
jgi:hypothetical protein